MTATAIRHTLEASARQRQSQRPWQQAARQVIPRRPATHHHGSRPVAPARHHPFESPIRRHQPRQMMCRLQAARVGIAVPEPDARQPGKPADQRAWNVNPGRRDRPGGTTRADFRQLPRLPCGALWRRGWDSNPRYLAAQRFSRPSQSTTLAPLLERRSMRARRVEAPGYRRGGQGLPSLDAALGFSECRGVPIYSS